ncbi:MAG: metal ABC transporter permease [Eubacteriales bacterium]|nr:metal ABC transporter permease [Eubacteriales bacterium]
MMEQMLTYSFFQRALIVGILLSVCSSLLGVTLVLKRCSMIGDGLSHVGFGALAIAVALNLTPMYVAIPCVVIASFILLKINEKSVKGDAAIALISSSALAIGIMVVSLSSGMNMDVNNYMFGSILSLTKNDVILTVILSIAVVVTYFLFYNRIFMVTFDETYAQAIGIDVKFYNTIIAILTAITVVLGMRMMGALLVSSLIIFPGLTSMKILKSYRGVVVSSIFVSVFCLITGMILSVIWSTPTGATIVFSNLIVYLIASATRLIRR